MHRISRVWNTMQRILFSHSSLVPVQIGEFSKSQALVSRGEKKQRKISQISLLKHELFVSGCVLFKFRNVLPWGRKKEKRKKIHHLKRKKACEDSFGLNEENMCERESRRNCDGCNLEINGCEEKKKLLRICTSEIEFWAVFDIIYWRNIMSICASQCTANCHLKNEPADSVWRARVSETNEQISYVYVVNSFFSHIQPLESHVSPRESWRSFLSIFTAARWLGRRAREFRLLNK